MLNSKMEREEILEAKIEKAEYDGWAVSERKKHTVLLEKQSFGSLTAHAVIAILTAWWTFGIGNLLYALYKYLKPAKMVLDINELNEEPEIEETAQKEEETAQIEEETADETVEPVIHLEEKTAEETVQVENPDSEIEEVDIETKIELKSSEERKQDLEERKLRLQEEKLKLEGLKEQRRRRAESAKDTREVMRTFRKFF